MEECGVGYVSSHEVSWSLIFAQRYFFMEFASAEEAANAVKTGNGYRLDKSHVFAVNFFSDFEK